MLTLYEYEARMHAFSLSEIDKERDMHVQAWLNHQVTATKGKDAKPAFKEFKDFFDYEKRIKELEGNKSANELSDKLKRMAQIAKKSNERG